MKKFYILAALAAVGMSAYAAPVASKVMSSKNAQLQEFVNVKGQAEVATNGKYLMTRADGPAKKITSVKDLLGSYIFYYASPWFDNMKGDYVSPYFVQGDTENEIIIKNLYYGDVDLVAYVDMANHTLTIPKQDVFYYPSTNQMAYFQIRNASVNESTGAITYQMGEKLVLEFDENGFAYFGTLRFNDDTTFEATTFDGFGYMIEDNRGFWGASGWRMEGIDWFTFDPAEWEQINNSTVTDDFMVHFLKNSDPIESTATAYRAKDNHLKFCFTNMYHTGDWAQINTEGTDIGYYVIDASYPDCAYTNLYTLNGFYFNDYDENDTPIGTFQAAPYNDECQKVQFEDYTPEEVYDEFSVLGIDCSYFDETKGIIYIYNLWFGDNNSPLDKYGFVAERNPDGTVKKWYPCSLEFTVSLDGVNEVEFDSNAPVKYFNLQGVEVANPAKGQLVIKTQGNKAKKVVIR